ncbi:MAG TPA: hypothetical protein VGJ94_01545 [Syntrophorhabdaceae bacterium]|jgi:hypothetical protein
MFVRIKKAGRYEYLQVVENHRVKGKSVQRVIATLGRMDQLKARGEIESVVRSLSRFTDKPILLLSERSEGIRTDVRKAGPSLVFERLWEDMGIAAIFHQVNSENNTPFRQETEVFRSVLHCILGSEYGSLQSNKSGPPFSGRPCDGPVVFDALCGFLGSGGRDNIDCIGISASSLRDRVEHGLFSRRSDPVAGKGTPSLYGVPLCFPAGPGKVPGKQGSEEGTLQGIAAMILDGDGYPLCSQFFNGRQLDTKNLTRFLERSMRRFTIDMPSVVLDEAAVGGKGAACPEKKGRTSHIAVPSGRNEPNGGPAEFHEVREVLLNGLSPLEEAGISPPSDDIAVGLVVVGFMALVLRKELERRLCDGGFPLDWRGIRQGLDTLMEITIEENGKRISFPTEPSEDCSKILEILDIDITRLSPVID